ncbi:hypothetical protein LCGC14_3126170, partial [marine sediment metagenome]
IPAQSRIPSNIRAIDPVRSRLNSGQGGDVGGELVYGIS